VFENISVEVNSAEFKSSICANYFGEFRIARYDEVDGKKFAFLD